MNLFENLQMLNESNEIKTFNISFKYNDVYQANLIKGYSEEQVINYFKSYKPDAEILGVKLATKDDEKPGKPIIDTTKESFISKDDNNVEEINKSNDSEEPVIEAKSSSKSNANEMTYKGQQIQNQDWAEYKIGTYVEIINPINNKSLDIKMGISGYGRLAGKVKDTYVYNDGADNLTAGGSNHNYHELNPSADQSCLIEVHDDFKVSQHNDKTNRIIVPTEYLKEISEKEYKDIVNKIPRKGFDKLFNKNKTRIEATIVKDEKDMEQVVEGTRTLTEDSDNILDLVEAKAKRFGAMVDAIGEDMPTSEVNDFLKGLTTELGMDVYEGGEPYPTDLEGYLGMPIADIDVNDENDIELINWIDSVLTECITKTERFVKSRIEILKGEISAIERDIAILEGVL